MLLSHCAASCSKPSNDVSSTKRWKDPDVKRLVSERRSCRDSGRRLELSKAIMKAVRIAKRKYCSLETKVILEQFKDLKRLNLVRDSPSSVAPDQQCSPDSFALLLESVYASTSPCASPCKDAIRKLSRFTIQEFKKAMAQIPSNRCSDCLGVTIEMVKHGHHRLHQVLLTLLNSCIEHGCIDDHWKCIVFSMIPKQGDLTPPPPQVLHQTAH